MTRAPVGRSQPLTETALLLASFILLASPPPSEAGSTSCFDGNPAIPVPEFVGGERIWPPSGLQPTNPGQQLPPERDSTQYVGLPSQLPGAGSTLELFTDLDIVGNYIYTAYNSGLQIWDISGGSAADPQRMTFRDGFARHFLEFEPTPTEVYFLIFGIDAIDPPTAGEDVLVALAGHSPAGFSIWDATNKSTLRQLYQDPDRWGEDVATAHINGRTYAFFAMSAGGGAGLHVYDMTSARSLSTPCLDGRDSCIDVYRGELGDWSSVKFVSYLERNGRHYVVVSDGPSTAFGIAIHEVLDPLTAFSSQVFSGLSTTTQGVAFFAHGGRAYLAVQRSGNAEIYDVTTCLDSRSCGSLQNSTPVWSAPVGIPGMVSVSRADAPYVYYGTDSPCQEGTKKEHLFNVDSLSSGNPSITEATAGGGIFPDPQSDKDVDYWGYYLDRNSTGFSFLIPRAAKAHRAANGQVYVYRTAFTMLDVHQFGGESTTPGEPAADVDLGSGEAPNSLWLGDDISFVATPENCNGPSDWQWWSRASGQPLVSLGMDDVTHTHRWNVGTDQVLEIGATKLVCDSGETMTEETVTPVPVILRDPRPVIPGIAIEPGGSSYPHGRQLTFSPSQTIGGKQPFGHQWRVRTNGGQLVTLPDTTGGVLNLDTCDLPFNVTDIFANGFETGGTGGWSLTLPIPPPTEAVFPEPATEKSGLSLHTPVKAVGSMYTVELTATASVDAGSFSDVEALPFEIVQPGNPAFDGTPLSSVDLGLGRYEVTAHTNGLETEVRWEIEDVNGNDTCSFGDCVLLDWGEEGSTIEHVWTTPNEEVPHTVRAAIRSVKCDGSFAAAPPQQFNVLVENVTTPVAPSVTLFRVVEGGEASCSCPGFGAPCECSANQPVAFEVKTDVPVNTIMLTWGDGQVQTVAPSEDNLYTHTYTSSSFYAPTVKAVAGELSSPVESLPELTLHIQ